MALAMCECQQWNFFLSNTSTQIVEAFVQVVINYAKHLGNMVGDC